MFVNFGFKLGLIWDRFDQLLPFRATFPPLPFFRGVIQAHSYLTKNITTCRLAMYNVTSTHMKCDCNNKSDTTIKLNCDGGAPAM